jgi:hypothetical protein
MHHVTAVMPTHLSAGTPGTSTPGGGNAKAHRLPVPAEPVPALPSMPASAAASLVPHSARRLTGNAELREAILLTAA